MIVIFVHPCRAPTRETALRVTRDTTLPIFSSHGGCVQNTSCTFLKRRGTPPPLLARWQW